MAWFGWRVVFGVFGCASLVWLWPWLRTVRAPIKGPAAGAADHPTTGALLRSRELWGSCLGNFAEAYALYLVLSWLPVYLVTTRGFSMANMAQLGAGVYALSAVASVLTGWISDRWLAAGASSTRVRKTLLVAGNAALAVSLLACAWAGPVASLLAMTGCGVCLGVLLPVIWASAQTLAGPPAAARWFGVQNFCTNFAGISAPVITGIVVDRTGSFEFGFLIAAGFAAVSVFSFGVIVRRIEPIDWRALASVGPLPTVAESARGQS